MVPLQPARDLETALGAMTFTVLEGRFALVGFEGALVPADWAALERAPATLVREHDETSLLVRADEVELVRARHPSARVERDLVWIRFDAPMTLDVVGFLAHVTGELARAGVPLGVVCSFGRDHVFIAERHLPIARACLARSFPSS